VSALELWLRAAAALGLIALVLGGLRYLLRGLPAGAWPRRGGRVLAVVETLPLANAAVVYVVRIGARYFALGGTHGGVQCICEVPAGAIDAQ